MKNIQIAALSLALALAACGGEEPVDENTTDSDEVTEESVEFMNATIDDFGKTLIGSFRTGDVDLFKMLAIDQDARIEYIKETVQDDSVSTMLIQGITGNAGLWEDFQFNDETFNRLIEIGGRLGVKWESVQFESVEVDIHDVAGMKQADGKIIFSSSGKRYEFIIIECYELGDGWYGMGLQVEESIVQESTDDATM